jgi:hypothetical protein
MLAAFLTLVALSAAGTVDHPLESPPMPSERTSAPGAADPYCAEVLRWPAPRKSYSDLGGNEDMLRVRPRPLSSRSGSCEKTEDHLFCFDSTSLNSIQFFGPKDDAIEVSVPDMAHRQLTARWVNTKLAYLEMWFNPHFGAFWLYDAEKGQVVYRQLMNDGINVWFYCRTDPPR